MKKKIDKKMKHESSASILRRYKESIKNAPKVEKRLPVTVTDLTKRGFRIHFKDKQFYMSFKNYPWFVDATEEEITRQTIDFYSAF